MTPTKIKWFTRTGLLLLFFYWSCSGPGSRAREEDVLDALPEPVRGFQEIQKYLFYPEFARKHGVEGKVVVEALITETGEVAETNIIESLGAECDKEAIRAIQSVVWKPAMQKGIPVRSQILIPIYFKLQKMHPNN